MQSGWGASWHAAGTSEPAVSPGRSWPGRPGHAPARRCFCAVPDHVGNGFARRESQPRPSRQRQQQPGGARQAARADQREVQGFCHRARRQLLGHRVPRSGGQPAPPGQMSRCPAGRQRRLGANTAVKPGELTKGGQPGCGQQRSARQIPGGETGDSSDSAAHLGKPEPGPPCPPPPSGLRLSLATVTAGPPSHGTSGHLPGSWRRPAPCPRCHRQVATPHTYMRPPCIAYAHERGSAALLHD